MSRREVRKVTEARKEIFLRVLGETGSRAAAAAAASPHTDGGKGLRPGYETFRDLCKRDPEFALAVEQTRWLLGGQSTAYGAVGRTCGSGPTASSSGSTGASSSSFRPGADLFLSDLGGG